MTQKQILQLKDTLMTSDSPYVLTGAGISTESGIPDFRGKDGLWKKIDPMEYSTRDVLMMEPQKFYEYGFPRFRDLRDREPNKGHLALAEMEKAGVIKGIITQNIDNLHHKAGSKQVYEVHGNTRQCHCMQCRQTYPFTELIDQLDQQEEASDPLMPVCHDCGSMLRPDIVLFGDPMPDTFFEAADIVRRDCDFLLVVGTSLQVYPVASLADFGKPMGIINLDSTAFDQEAQVVIHGPCGETLEAVWELIQEEK